jgi:hypothetical protein
MCGAIILRNSGRMNLENITVIDSGDVEIINSLDINIERIDIIKSSGTKIINSKKVTINNGFFKDVDRPFVIKKSKKVKISSIKASYTPKMTPLAASIRKIIHERK